MQHPLRNHIQPHARRGGTAQQPGTNLIIFLNMSDNLTHCHNPAVFRRPGRHPRGRPADPAALHVQGRGVPPPGQDQLGPQDR